MGKGNGFEMNLDMILRIIELILLTVAMILFLINSDRNPEILTYAHTYSVAQGDDAMNMSASIFIIVLVILVCMKLFKDEELDQEFVGWLAIVGTALLIPTGIVVCINYRNGSGSIIISGIMAIVAGCCLLVEALKDLGVF
ncbi:hypothetical protein ABEB36_011883 [Hypothenemus hampei]|uniref:Uncharacterized protein n=1 Tax=Hypothenemus hampei TaxID=57062 RepID=A0ABD1E9M8_HYPHA